MERTIEYWTALVIANPFDGEAHAELARLQFDSGEFAPAREAAATAAELGAGEFGEMVLLDARCAARLGQTEEARDLLVEAMAA
jgi:Flp pilus assembly protein TadD